MFLKKYKPFINSLRFKKKIDSSLSNFKNIKIIKRNFFKKKILKRNKFLKKTNYIYNVNQYDNFFSGCFIFLNYIKIQYSNKFLSFCLTGNNEILVKDTFFGFSLIDIYDNSFLNSFSNFMIKKTEIIVHDYNFVFFFKTNSPFYKLSHKNYQYACSAGTFCLYTNHDQTNDILYLRIPSKQIIQAPLSIKGFLGRMDNIFSKFYHFSSFKQKQILKKHRQKVRGVAMNAFEHPNGGSSKTKRPLRTPWGKIAKKNK